MKIKKLLHKLLFLALLIGISYVLWYNSVNNAPQHFIINNINYTDSKIPEDFDGFKIGFISDFDLKSTADLDYLESCIEKLNSQSCDIVIFGGDLYETGKIFDENRLISILKSIQAPYGKIAVLGENEFLDNLDDSIQLLENGGFEVLRNVAHPIYYKNSSIIFAGLETSGNIDKLISNEDTNSFIFCAVHQPDYFKDISLSNASLQLSGHSGGGFVYLPIYGSFFKLDGAQTYTHGHYKLNDCDLYISNGIGMGHEQTARFNCHPDALVMTLHSEKEIAQTTEQEQTTVSEPNQSNEIENNTNQSND